MEERFQVLGCKCINGHKMNLNHGIEQRSQNRRGYTTLWHIVLVYVIKLQIYKTKMQAIVDLDLG